KNVFVCWEAGLVLPFQLILRKTGSEVPGKRMAAHRKLNQCRVGPRWWPNCKRSERIQKRSKGSQPPPPPHGKVRTIKRNDSGKNDGRGRSRACWNLRNRAD